jgi:hypothetical protein
MGALLDGFEQRSNSTWLIASRSLVEENQNVEEDRATAHGMFASLFLSRIVQLIPIINLNDTCFCRGCKEQRRAQHSTFFPFHMMFCREREQVLHRSSRL